MTRKRSWHAAAGGLLAAVSGCAAQAGEGKLPPDFVYLRAVAPSIVQDMRYATPGNFTGKPVPGYDAAECVLKRSAAEALKRAQENAQKQGYSLKVYDCYRPVRAVQAFMAWTAAREDGRTKRYYPHLSKLQLVPSYIADRSGHSAGASIDLTLVPLAAAPLRPRTGPPGDCTAPAQDREPDTGLDMGTAFDCFDPKANTNSPLVTPEQRKARMLLKSIMEAAGFKNYAGEWWHFSYAAANSGKLYDFQIEPPPR